MKNWQETRYIVDRILELEQARIPSVLATIVRIQGSTYRRPGAKLLIAADGSMTGNVSGGCLEQDVREAALNVIETGRPRVVHYDTSDAEDTVWGMGLGCNGAVDLLLQSVAGQMDQWQARAKTFESKTTQVMRIPLDGGHMGEVQPVSPPEGVTGSMVRVEEGHEVFYDVLHPPPVLLICGAGDDALPLVALAGTVGFSVVLVDHRRAYLTSARFPLADRFVHARPEEGVEAGLVDFRTLVIVKTHAVAHDAAWVHYFLKSETPYIGLLGPRERRSELLKQIDPAQHTRIFGPVGLDLGGEGPEQVALSIVAEVLAVWNQRRPIHLREREQAIHARSSHEGDS